MSKQPTQDQKLIAHIAVGLAGAVAGQKVAGIPGLVFGAIFPPFLHAVLDAPLAALIAEAA